MPAFLKYIFSRAVVFYVLAALLVWHILDYNKLMANAIPQTMSRLTPPIDYFTEFVDRNDHYDRFKLMNCVNYHKAVIDFFSFQRAEGYGMLGFCYERLGDEFQAEGAYKEAIALNPDYFWPYYDLGVLAWRHAQYDKAVGYLHQAIEQAPLKTIYMLARSKVYNDVRLSQETGTYNVLEGIKEGRHQAYVLLMDSMYKLGAYSQLFAFLQQVLQDDPQNADALLYMGMCLHAAGKDDMAALMMKRAQLMYGQNGLAGPDLKPRVRFF